MRRSDFGQRFLTLSSVAKKIVVSCGCGSQDEVLEIGPGHGELTQYYLGKVAKTYLIEIDSKLCESLQQKWGGRKDAEIIRADFRKLDLNNLPLRTPPIILSNLPYYASKPILAKILNWSYYKRAVLMLQKELAERIFAQAGSSSFGALSLFFQMKAQGEMLFDVAPEAFSPKPKVTSTVIRIEPKNYPASAEDKAKIERLIRLAFKHRRKTLLNNLASSVGSKAKIEEILRGSNIASAARPQEINLDAYAMLSRRLIV